MSEVPRSDGPSTFTFTSGRENVSCTDPASARGEPKRDFLCSSEPDEPQLYFHHAIETQFWHYETSSHHVNDSASCR